MNRINKRRSKRVANRQNKRKPTTTQPSRHLPSLNLDPLGGELRGPKHKPLDSSLKQIRVLEVAPRKRRCIVVCTTKVISLLDDPIFPYETISYCWGSHGRYSTIRLNGELVRVPASSEAAIKCMRLTDRPRVLWIDAICIDQSSDAEKSEQVGMMADIYRLGTRNLVYLGEDPNNMAERASASIRSLTEEIREQTDEFRLLFQTLWDRTSGAVILSEEGFLEKTRVDDESLVELFSAPWFW